MTLYYGAEHNLEQLITTHLFVICPNNSGSTFLKNALATSKQTWNLLREGQHTFGFAGPSSNGLGAHKRWASEKHWIDTFTNPKNYAWATIRRAWYFQAFSLNKTASIFVEKSPSFLLIVDQLVEQFINARFLFMVRDPYAVVEGARRQSPQSWLESTSASEVLTSVATHVINCLSFQRRNLEAWGKRGVFFKYEMMCEQPEQVARSINNLVPELDDLNLKQRLEVKTYDEMLRNMNEQQIDRLTSDDKQQINKVFRQHQDVLDYFNYPLRD